MFKPALTPKFWATCHVEYTDENGRKVPGKFGVQFKRHEREAIDTLNASIKRQIADGETLNADAEFLRDTLIGFRDVEIPAEYNDGVEISAEQTPEMLAYLTQVGFAGAMVQAFFAEYPKARGKN